MNTLKIEVLLTFKEIYNACLKRFVVVMVTLTVFVLLSTACNNKIDRAKYESLLRENTELKERLREKISSQAKESGELSTAGVGKYIFVILYIEETKGFPPELLKSQYVSQIIPVHHKLTSEVAARLLDEVQDKYLSSVDARMYKGKVIQRGLDYFDTYEDASAARAKELAK